MITRRRSCGIPAELLTNTPNAVFVPEKDEIILHALERRVAAAVLVDVEILIFARGLDGVLEAAALVDIIKLSVKAGRIIAEGMKRAGDIAAPVRAAVGEREVGTVELPEAIFVPVAEAGLLCAGINVGSGVGRAVRTVIEHPTGESFGKPAAGVAVWLYGKALCAIEMCTFVPAEMIGEKQSAEGALDGDDSHVESIICLRLAVVVGIAAACALFDDHALGAETGEKVLVGEVVELGFGIAEGEEPFMGFDHLCVGAGLFGRPVHAVGAEKQEAAGNDDSEDGEQRADELVI